MSAKFTLTLDEDAAERIDALTSYFGGSVPGFAAAIATDLSRLPIEEIVRLRQHIAERIHELDATAKSKRRNATAA